MKLVFLIFSLCFMLLGCSQSSRDMASTLKIATLGYEDVPVSQQQLNALPYSAITLQWGQGPRVLSVLALAENGQLKWVTQDRNMVVTQHGRVVKTLGFGQNLAYTANLENDPLANWLATPANERTWRTELDWQPGHVSGMEARSRFVEQGLEWVTLVEEPEQLLRVEEHVVYPRIEREYVNVFWLRPATGEVAKTQQRLGPDLPVVTLSFVKP